MSKKMPKDTRRELRLRCPRCLRARGVGSLNLYKDSKVCSTPCNSCHTTSSANKWLCECGGPWVQCPKCRPLGFSCRSNKRPRTPNSPTAHHKRPALAQVPEWVSRLACKRKASFSTHNTCIDTAPFPPRMHSKRQHVHTTHHPQTEANERKHKLVFALGHKLGAKFPRLMHSQTAAGEDVAG